MPRILKQLEMINKDEILKKLGLLRRTALLLGKAHFMLQRLSCVGSTDRIIGSSRRGQEISKLSVEQMWDGFVVRSKQGKIYPVQRKPPKYPFVQRRNSCSFVEPLKLHKCRLMFGTQRINVVNDCCAPFP